MDRQQLLHRLASSNATFFHEFLHEYSRIWPIGVNNMASDLLHTCIVVSNPLISYVDIISNLVICMSTLWSILQKY